MSRCMSDCVCVCVRANKLSFFSHYFIGIGKLKRDKNALICLQDGRNSRFVVCSSFSFFFVVFIIPILFSLCSVAWEPCLSGNHLFVLCVDRL